MEAKEEEAKAGEDRKQSSNSNNTLLAMGNQTSFDDNYFSSLKSFKDCKPKGDALYFVLILGTKRVKEVRGKSFFTTYKLRVFNNEGAHWITLRRYREFRALQQKIKHEYEKEESLPHNFPGKKIVGNMDPWHIDERHMKLQTWFNKVLSHPVLGHSDAVKSFLEEYKLSESAPPSSSSSLDHHHHHHHHDQISSSSLSSTPPDDDSLIKLDLGRMGYLYKLHHGQWKKGWFVLRNDVLFKYRSHIDKHPYGEYLWREVTVQEVELPGGTGLDDDFCCFMVTTAKNKKYVFATTEEDCEEWINAINSAVEY